MPGEVLYVKKKREGGNSLVAQWLGLCAVTPDGPGSVPGWGTKIPQAMAQPEKRTREVLFFISSGLEILMFQNTYRGIN